MLIRKCFHEKRLQESKEIKELIWDLNPELRLFFDPELRKRTIYEEHIAPYIPVKKKRMNPGRLRQRLRRDRKERHKKLMRKEKIKKRDLRPKKTSVI